MIEPDMATGAGALARILIVEDDRNVREVVAQILEVEGFQVRGASNGHEALAMLRRCYQPDLILLNLTMPVMNGWAFRAEQRLDGRIASIPVVLLSGEPHLDEIARSLGIDDALPKPVFVPELLQLVKTVLRRES